MKFFGFVFLLVRVRYNLQCQLDFYLLAFIMSPANLCSYSIFFLCIDRCIWPPQAKLYCINFSFALLEMLNYTRKLFKSAHTHENETMQFQIESKKHTNRHTCIRNVNEISRTENIEQFKL